MVTVVREFQGEWRWLSNFWPCEVEFFGVTFKCAEAAYMAHKSLNPEDWKALSTMKGGDAKRYGRRIKLRPDWDDVKLECMEAVVRQKFSDANPELRDKLIATGDATLVEGNRWNDIFWGVCDGRGQNHLGRIIMKVRDELRGVTNG